ncbi:MAG: hypothetical protein QM778_24180 [Myxococcales bacterium]
MKRWSNLLALRAYALLLLASLVLACESTSTQPDGIVVAVYSDLVVGSELSTLTATVMDQDGSKAAEHTFQLDATAQGDSNLLVSFGVQRGHSERLYLKLQGFVGAQANSKLVIERVLEARFVSGKTALLRALLGARCLEKLSCDGHTTCDPSNGGCMEIADAALETRDPKTPDDVHWLPTNYAPRERPQTFDSGSDAAVDSGADSGADTLAPGLACTEAAACDSRSCLGGFCCAGLCSHDHVAPSCQGGGCESGICDDGYADCNGDKATDGCETKVASDPNHCGICQNVCDYGACQGGACVTYVEGSQSKAQTFDWEAGTVWSFRIYNQHPGKLASMGVLAAAPNQAQLYFALYLDNGGARGSRLIQSDVLTVDAERVEWRVPANVDVPMLGDNQGYWFLFTLSAKTTLYTDPGNRDFWSSTGTPEFGPIMGDRPDDVYNTFEHGIRFPNLFFTVVPSGESGS